MRSNSTSSRTSLIAAKSEQRSSWSPIAPASAGVPVECAVWAHFNRDGEADSILVNHHPLEAALLFSHLMWEKVGDRYGELYLTEPEAEAFAAARHRGPRAEPELW
jgi:hypothetical protein